MADFSKRHYEYLSLRINSLEDRLFANRVAYLLANEFARDNMRFNFDRFIKACGVENDS